MDDKPFFPLETSMLNEIALNFQHQTKFVKKNENIKKMNEKQFNT